MKKAGIKSVLKPDKKKKKKKENPEKNLNKPHFPLKKASSLKIVLFPGSV